MLRKMILSEFQSSVETDIVKDKYKHTCFRIIKIGWVVVKKRPPRKPIELIVHRHFWCAWCELGFIFFRSHGSHHLKHEAHTVSHRFFGVRRVSNLTQSNNFGPRTQQYCCGHTAHTKKTVWKCVTHGKKTSLFIFIEYAYVHENTRPTAGAGKYEVNQY